MPLPGGLVSAALITCERALIERDNVVSAVRLVDVFYVQETANLPEKLSGVVQLYAVLALKVGSAASTGEHEVTLELIRPDGVRDEVGKKYSVNFAPRIDGVPGGHTIITQLNVRCGEPQSFGTYQICAFLDRDELARTPFTILLQAQQHRPGVESDVREGRPEDPATP